MRTLSLERKVKSMAVKAIGQPSKGTVWGLVGTRPKGSFFLCFPRQYSLQREPVNVPRMILSRVQGGVQTSKRGFYEVV